MEEKMKFNNNYSNEIRQGNIRKLKVNKKAKEGIFNRGMAVILATAIASGTIIACFRKNGPSNTVENRKEIVTYYGSNSAESRILRYLDIAVELDDLNLDQYSATQKLDDNFDYSMNLDTPAYIDLKIKKFIKERDSFDETKLNSTYDYISTIMYLKHQKELIDNYITEYGHDIVYKDLTSSLKEYAAEEYNLEDPYRVTFKDSFQMSSGEAAIVLEYDQGYKTDKSVVNNKDIKSGVEKMTEMNDIKNSNEEISNEERLDKYVSTLLEAMQLKNIVNEKDLYNEDSERRLKGI